MKRLLCRSALLVAAALVLLSPSVARADDSGKPAPIWLVYVDDQAAAGGRNWGALSVKDGRVTFASNSGDLHWQVDLADASRIAPSKRVDGALDIELRNGKTFVVTVLDARMLPQSPRMAIKTIADAAATAKTDGRRLASATSNAPAAAPSDVRTASSNVRNR